MRVRNDRGGAIVEFLLAGTILLLPVGLHNSLSVMNDMMEHRGYNVLVFPEGRHTQDGKLCPFRAGIGLLVNNLGIPVLPLRIDGLFEIKSAGKRFTAPGRIQVRIGKPIPFPPETDLGAIAEELQKIVGSL